MDRELIYYKGRDRENPTAIANQNLRGQSVLGRDKRFAEGRREPN